MSVYLGDTGTVEIRRTGEPVGFTLDPEDVDVAARRMSTEWSGPCPFITGDQVEIKTVDGSQFELIQGVTDFDVTRWVHLDQIGGIRFYDSYPDSVNGGKANALEIAKPLTSLDVTMDVVNAEYGSVAQMRSWEITTSRETIDLTLLGDEFRSSYDQGLISGQGQITAIWDYEWTKCEDDKSCTDAEFAQYFSRLVIRFKEGSKFTGRFVVFDGQREAVWYECDCVVTSVGMNFAAGQIIESTIQYVTTGVIEIKQGAFPSYLQQENTEYVELEQTDGLIELETDLD